MEYSFTLTYLFNNEIKTISSEKFLFENDELLLKGINDHSLKNSKYSFEIKAKKEIQLIDFKISKDYTFKKDDLLFLNGYQSWTETKEYYPNEKIRSLNKLPKSLKKRFSFEEYGDSYFLNVSGKKGDFHGFTYAYIRNDTLYHLIASRNDFNAYTIIRFNCRKNLIQIESDIKNLILKENSKFMLLDFVEVEGKEKYVFDCYKEFFPMPEIRVKPISGFCSWYNYYQNISEKIILENLNEIAKAGNEIFQIDDGFQTFVGDFLSIDKNKFPNGLKVISDKIHEKGMKAGIWLAPLCAETKSEIAKNHKDWLIKDKNGEPLYVGCGWSRHYAYDIYNKDVQKYIKKIFKFMVVDNNFDFLKLDFLYSACLGYRTDKTRAQVMRYTMEFIRKNTYGAEILGCGVPLVSAAGLVDYCRIGPDVSLKFDDHFFMKIAHRERISTKQTILNTISRRHIDKYWFLNDPDVYLLRDENMHMNKKQKFSLGLINHIFGSLYLTSDNIAYYDDKKFEMNELFKKFKNAKYSNVRREGNKYLFDAKIKKENFSFTYNIDNGSISFVKK